MKYTLGQAAKATGKHKSTIQRAYDNGLISGVKNRNGSYEFEPSEIHRVFPAIISDSLDGEANRHLRLSEIPVETEGYKKEKEVLQQLIKSHEVTIDYLKSQLEEAQNDRREADKERRELKLITDQREAELKQARQQATEKPKDQKNPYLVFLILVLIALIGFIAYLAGKGII